MAAVQVEVPSVEVDIESVDMSTTDLLQALQSVYEIPIVTTVGESVIVRGSWTDSAELINQIMLTVGGALLKVDGSYVIKDESESLTYIRWPSGRTVEDATRLLAALGLGQTLAVDQSGVAVIGLPPGEVSKIKKLLSDLDGGADWLVQISVVDASVSSTLDGSVFDLDQVEGGYLVSGTDIIDTYLITLQSGLPREQSFGSQIPFRTSVVNESGVVLTGSVAYQDLETVLQTEIVESSVGPKLRVTIDSRRPGAEIDGLFEIISEQLDTEVYVRQDPILIGSLRRWGATSQIDLAWPLSAFNKFRRSRKYQVWAHAVRLPSPVADLSTADPLLQYPPEILR